MGANHEKGPTDGQPTELEEGDLAIQEVFRASLSKEAEAWLPEAPDGLWADIERRLPPAGRERVERRPSRSSRMRKGLLALAACVVIGLAASWVDRMPSRLTKDPGISGPRPGAKDAAEALRGPAPSWLVEALESLHHADPLVRAVAAETLGKASTHLPEVRAALRAALQDPDAAVRSATAEALDRIPAGGRTP